MLKLKQRAKCWENGGNLGKIVAEGLELTVLCMYV